MNSDNEALVRRLIHEVINRGRLELVEQLFSPELAGTIRQAFTSFRNAFPDWREDIVYMVSDAGKVAARLRCSRTLPAHAGRARRRLLGARGQPDAPAAIGYRLLTAAG